MNTSTSLSLRFALLWLFSMSGLILSFWPGGIAASMAAATHLPEALQGMPLELLARQGMLEVPPLHMVWVILGLVMAIAGFSVTAVLASKNDPQVVAVSHE